MSGEGAYLGAPAPQDAKAQIDPAVEILQAGLMKIAAYDDVRASAVHARNGSFSLFDEPGSVQIARETLSAFASLREAK